MNCKQANTISILNYLSAIDIHPKKTRSRYTFFLSPFRDEKTPSFKVDHNLNTWIDFGSNNISGTLVDLVLLLNPSFSISMALSHIEELTTGTSFSFQKQKPSETIKIENGIRIQKIRPIGTNSAITDYLQSRRISIPIAQKFCKEVYYEVGGKRYFGVGNENPNGWSIRNKYWKGCTGQGVSRFENPASSSRSNLAVFEGIFDLMSLFELQSPSEIPSTIISLNSLANIEEANSDIQNSEKAELYLDRDEAGMNATQELLGSFSNCFDRSSLYCSFKDLNEMICQ